jgi:8-oxo-dGTP pyrophosphatase MutT (NUDIX family)
MERQFRISAGGIVIHENRILLVRYRDEPGYLVAPGGGVESDEGLNQAVIREVREETGIEVAPRNNRILFVEDLISSRKRLTKVWFLCNVIGGRLARTPGAEEEGISEAGWYSREQLNNTIVFPSPILTYDWGLFFGDNWESVYLEMKNADFGL